MVNKWWAEVEDKNADNEGSLDETMKNFHMEIEYGTEM